MATQILFSILHGILNGDLIVNCLAIKLVVENYNCILRGGEFQFQPPCILKQGGQQKVSHYQMIKNRIKSY